MVHIPEKNADDYIKHLSFTLYGKKTYLHILMVMDLKQPAHHVTILDACIVLYMSRNTVPCVGRSQRSSITGDQQPLWIVMPSIKF